LDQVNYALLESFWRSSYDFLDQATCKTPYTRFISSTKHCFAKSFLIIVLSHSHCETHNSNDVNGVVKFVQFVKVWGCAWLLDITSLSAVLVHCTIVIVWVLLWYG